MLESKLWQNKTENENEKVVKIVKFFKTCDQYPHKFIFGYFFSSIILSPFCWGKNIFSKNRGWRGVMIRAWGKVLLRAMSKNEQIQFFDSQIYFPVILTL